MFRYVEEHPRGLATAAIVGILALMALAAM